MSGRSDIRTLGRPDARASGHPDGRSDAFLPLIFNFCVRRGGGGRAGRSPEPPAANPDAAQPWRRGPRRDERKNCEKRRIRKNLRQIYSEKALPKVIKFVSNLSMRAAAIPLTEPPYT